MQDHIPGSSSRGNGSGEVSEEAGAGGSPELGHTSGQGGQGSGDMDPEADLFTHEYYTHPALLAPIDASPLPNRIHNQPLLAPSELRGGLCPCCSLISREVTEQYRTPLEESADEGMT